MIKRKSLHKSNCNNENGKHNNFKLYKTIRDNGGWDNWRMVIIDELGDVSKRQAEMKEEEWRVELQANLNSKKCYITEEQKKEQNKEYNKEYHMQNRDKIAERHKEYNKQNRDKIVEYQKEYNNNYYKQNRDIIAEQQKEYRQKNIDKILEQNRERNKEYYKQNRDKINEKITCECGCEVSKSCLVRHKKTKKHQAWEWRQTIQG